MEEQLRPRAHAPTLLSPRTRAGKAVTEAGVQRPPQEGKPQGEAPGTAAEGSSRLHSSTEPSHSNKAPVQPKSEINK